MGGNLESLTESAEPHLDWHKRFSRQASWTRDLRDYLFARAGILHARRILEVGSGTGALAAELEQRSKPAVLGLDIDFAHLMLSKANAPASILVQGDAHALPVAPNSFDITFCHFLLLWVTDPAQVVAEMARVTRRKGAVLALAEPDYGGRVDHPVELAKLAEWQTQALRNQGADVTMGRKLAGIFSEAGLREVETGVLGGQWSLPVAFDESEWQVLLSDLKSISGDALKEADLREYYRIERLARTSGERVLFVPTFYAWGKV